MKKLFVMFLGLLLCGITQAQQVEVTLNNGGVVKGETPSLSFYVDNDHEIIVKDKASGEKHDFTSTDVKEIKYYDKKAKEWMNWIPMVAQMGMSMSYKKEPKLYKNPIFLHPVYEGKHFRIYSLHKHSHTCEIWKFLRIGHYVLLQSQKRGLCEKLLFK